MNDSIKQSEIFKQFNQYSAQIGKDPLLVQAAGGNTSMKDGKLMWIKASGTWLMKAENEDIMVPVKLAPMLEAFNDNDQNMENAISYVPDELNPKGLRPSVETSMHGILNYRFVIHVHCVNTIAHSVLKNCEALLEEKLAGLDYAFIPYAKPGYPLSKSIKENINDKSNVLILGNHGVVVASDELDEAKALLKDVSQRLKIEKRDVDVSDLAALKRRNDHDRYQIADEKAQGIAFDKAGLSHAKLGSLYPDHVVFLGSGVVVADEGENVSDVVARYQIEFGQEPAFIIFEDLGCVMHKTASDGARALANCLSEVCLRVPEGAELNALSFDQDADLLNWDAEKYRQSLDK